MYINFIDKQKQTLKKEGKFLKQWQKKRDGGYFKNQNVGIKKIRTVIQQVIKYVVKNYEKECGIPNEIIWEEKNQIRHPNRIAQGKAIGLNRYGSSSGRHSFKVNNAKNQSLLTKEEAMTITKHTSQQAFDGYYNQSHDNVSNSLMKVEDYTLRFNGRNENNTEKKPESEILSQNYPYYEYGFSSIYSKHSNQLAINNNSILNNQITSSNNTSHGNQISSSNINTIQNKCSYTGCNEEGVYLCYSCLISRWYCKKHGIMEEGSMPMCIDCYKKIKLIEQECL